MNVLLAYQAPRSTELERVQRLQLDSFALDELLKQLGHGATVNVDGRLWHLAPEQADLVFVTTEGERFGDRVIMLEPADRP